MAVQPDPALRGHAVDGVSHLRALVLGGKGFIGRALVTRLGATSMDVDAWDLRRPVPSALWLGWDVVYLMAATLGVDTVCGDPANVLKTNISIVQNVLDWLPNRGETFVFASTSEVYALSVARGLAPIPTPEDVPLLVDPGDKRGSYALSKVAGESMVRHGHAQWVIVRYHNVYGPGQSRRGFVIPELIHGAPVHNPSTTRAFCYIDDAVEATILASQHPGQVFNIGNDEEVSIGHVAHMLRGTQIQLGIARDHDPLRRCPDLTKLKTFTGFQPKISLAEGLQRTQVWYRSPHV